MLNIENSDAPLELCTFLVVSAVKKNKYLSPFIIYVKSLLPILPLVWIILAIDAYSPSVAFVFFILAENIELNPCRIATWIGYTCNAFSPGTWIIYGGRSLNENN